jgi:hypothetical protein
LDLQILSQAKGTQESVFAEIPISAQKEPRRDLSGDFDRRERSRENPAGFLCVFYCVPASNRPLALVGVQVVFRFLRQGRAQKVAVELLDVRVLAGNAFFRFPVQFVQVFAAFPGQFFAGVDGLSATAAAAAGAGHDFHKVVLHVAVADGVHQGPRVGEAAGHGQAQGLARQGGGAFAPEPGVVGPGFPREERIRIGVLAFQCDVGVAHGRFHDAARRTEDDGAARALAHGSIKRFRLERRYIYVGHMEHAVQRARREDIVRVVQIRFGVDFRHGAFVFFRHAGHNGHVDDFFGSTPRSWA